MPEARITRGLAALGKQARRALAPLFAVLEGAGGTHAYSGYLEHHRRHHPGTPPLSREAFFRESLEARWHGVKRCC